MGFRFENLSVLVVEDTVPMRKIIHAVLMSLGVGRIYNACDGDEGFRAIMKHNPDIVITDWHMPESSGIELIEKIRRSANSPNRLVPVIMMTGYSAYPRVATARDSGVTEFMVKPFTAEELARRIAYVINRPRDFIDSKEYFGLDRRRVTKEFKNADRRKIKS